MKNTSIINIKNLSREFRVPVRNKGLKEAFKSLFRREYKIVNAVNSVSLEINEGELVALIGPNGAGKTTMFKMLAGLIYPTSGEISVAGNIPFNREKTFLKNISLLMGGRRRAFWDIPVIDSFELHKSIYEIQEDKYKNILDELVELLKIKELLNTPVRNLSLGQRMKCEVVLSLLHQPKILFLDEPTIGLDINTQKSIRDFISIYNKKHKATIMITSHNMSDIETLCSRVIIINSGKILYDGSIKNLINKTSGEKILSIEFKEKKNNLNLSKFGNVKSNTEGSVEIIVKKENISNVIKSVYENDNILDIEIKDPPIENIIDKIFLSGKL